MFSGGVPAAGQGGEPGVGPETLEADSAGPLQEARVELGALAERLQQTQQQREREQQRVADLERQLQGLLIRNSELERELEDAAQKGGQTELALVDAHAKRERLVAKLAKLEREVEDHDRRGRLMSAELAKLRVRTKKGKAALHQRAEESDTLRTRLAESERARHEASKAETDAVTELARAHVMIGGLQAREEEALGRIALLEVFAKTAVALCTESTRVCVGEAVALPLSIAWGRSTLPAALLPTHAPASVSEALAEHLRALGFEGLEHDPCLSGYCRAWRDAARQIEAQDQRELPEQREQREQRDLRDRREQRTQDNRN